MASSQGDLIVGLTWHEVSMLRRGNDTVPSLNVLDGIVAINLGCPAGPDGKIDVLDTCDGFVANGSVDAHVVPCKDTTPPIP